MTIHAVPDEGQDEYRPSLQRMFSGGEVCDEMWTTRKPNGLTRRHVCELTKGRHSGRHRCSCGEIRDEEKEKDQ